VLNKNFKSKNPNFVEDLKRLDKLSKEDAFINSLISSIVFTLNNEENKKIKGSKKYLFFWNRFKNKTIGIVVPDNRYNPFLFDHDLFSNFHLLTLKSNNLEVLFKNNLMELLNYSSQNNIEFSDFNEIIPSFLSYNNIGKVRNLLRDELKNLLSESISELYKIVFESIELDDFSDDAVEKFNNQETFPIDFLSPEQQYNLFWKRSLPFSSDYRPTVFKSKVLQIPVSRKLENGKDTITAVSIPSIFQKEKLMNPFNNYIEQIVDYSLELINDEDALFELKKEAISFLDNHYDLIDSSTAEKIKRSLLVFKNFYTGKFLDEDLKKLKSYIDLETYDYDPIDYEMSSRFFDFTDVKKEVLDKFICFLKENRGVPLDYFYRLPLFVYEEARKQDLLVEGYELIQNYLKTVSKVVNKPVILSPFYGYSFRWNDEQGLYSSSIDETRKLFKSFGVLTTKEIKEEIKLLKSTKMLRFSKKDKEFLDLFLELDEA
jgi:hypothetical protein